jgi:hypothetical protein
MTTDLIRTPETDLKIRNQARKYPDWWIETVLGRPLWRMQKAIAQATFYYPRVTCRSCEASGKTYDAAGIALCFLYNYQPATVITTAPTNRQVEDILWREIRVAFTNSKMPLEGNLTRKQLELSDDWFAVGFATDEPERMLGYHNVNVLVIGDDAAGLSQDIYGAIENPLSSGNTHELLISNPTSAIGSFRDTFESPLYKKYHISAFDTPNFTAFGITEEDIETGEWVKKWAGKEIPFPQLCSPQKVAERFKAWGKGSYLYVVFVLGDFPEAGVNNLCRLSDIEFAMSRELERKEYDKALVIAALDVARYGDDECAFAIRQGNKVLDIITWGFQDGAYTIGRTASLIKNYKPIRTYIDVVGMGGPILDVLKRELGAEYNILEFDAGKDALDKERYANRRAEGWWNFKTKLENGELDLLDNEKLKAQLSDLRYTYTTKGQFLMESKEQAKDRGSKSPDMGDAVMMTFNTKGGSGKPRTTTY